MRRTFAALACALLSLAAFADGIPLKDGRYRGPVMVFKLTQEQKEVIERFRNCHEAHFRTMNQYTPYVFRLSPEQAAAVKAREGFAPILFAVLETYRGRNDPLQWNVVLRFSEEQFEVPIDMLFTDAKAMKANEEVTGWKTNNPCFPSSSK
jgi:hypothetical protein